MKSNKRRERQSSYDAFSEMLRKVITPEAKARVDADKETRKRIKIASGSGRATSGKG